MQEIIECMCPYPFADGSSAKHDGFLISLPKLCQKCKANCRDYITLSNREIDHCICPHGVSIVLVKFVHGNLLCIGMLVKILNTTCPPPIRKQIQENKVSFDEIKNWHNNIKAILSKIEGISEQKAIELVNGFHNVKAAVNLVTRNAEAIIASLPGDNDEEKIEKAEPSLKSLLYSVDLLGSRLMMSSILSNPESASYGQKRRLPVYRLFHKMTRLFEEHAAREYKFLRIAGTSFNQPLCYDSLESLALVLLDNAVKYTKKGGQIEVLINDSASGGVAVEISSEGPIVPEEMKTKIFEKGVRTNQAKQYASSGSGFGLYIASLIASVHGFVIEYKCDPYKKTPDIGKNIFSFIIP